MSKKKEYKTEWDAKILSEKRRYFLRYAKGRGLPEGYAEDFASEAVLKLMRDRKALTQHLLIDFLRANFVGRDGRDKRSQSLFYTDEETGEMNQRVLDPYTTNQTASLELDEALSRITPKQRAMFLLKHKWGLEPTEIGYLFGRTCSQICSENAQTEELLKRRNV